MKKLTIGRNNACDIIVPDTSDLVSRKQAILTYSFWGKMILYDTSNNGTYINGQKLENGKGLKVTRKDKVNFARVADLDWNEVKDPYRKPKIMATICTIVLIIVVLVLTLWILRPQESSDSLETIENTEMTEEKGETVTTVQTPQEEKQPQPQPKKKPNNKKSQKKEHSVTPNEIMNKEVNENSPIVY